MGSRYTQLQAEERMTLASLHQQGCSLRAIGQLMGRSASTLSRELRRNASGADGYVSRTAQGLCRRRRIEARPLLSPTAVMEPPMFGVMEPATGE